MATTREEGAVPDFLRMDASGSSEAAKIDLSGDWYGWPSKDVRPVTMLDDEGRTIRIRTPVMDLEGLITPTELHYTVQHFDVPEVVPADKWSLSIDGEVKNPLTLSFDDLRRFPGRSVRTVMECSGSDATFFEYFKDEGPKPSRTQECMILSASEWTGVPLATVLREAGLTDKSLYIRAEGWDQGVPPTAEEGTEPFFYDKGLAVQKALHPDTILAWAQNGRLLEHLHGAPVRLLVPGWSGNWSVKWLRRLQVMDHMPDCWYHYQFYYYADSRRCRRQGADHDHRGQVDSHQPQRRHRQDVHRVSRSTGLCLERGRRDHPGGGQRRRRPDLGRRTPRTAPGTLHVGPLVLPLGRGRKRGVQHNVPGHRRGGTGAVPRASLQQYEQEFQRHRRLPGDRGVE